VLFRSADPIAVVKLIILHAAELDLYVTLIPLVALALLTTRVVRRGAGDRELRAFCLFAVTLSGCMLTLSSRYLAAVYGGSFLHAYDRYTFYLVPLLLISFFVWLEDGLPRPGAARLWTAAAAVLPLLLVSGPLLSVAWRINSTVVLAPWAVVRAVGGVPLVYALLVVGGCYLGWGALRCADRRWLVALVVINLLTISLFATLRSVQTAEGARRTWIGAGVSRTWIDDAVGSDAEVIVLWSGYRFRGARGWGSIWEAELLNRSVRRVYDLRDGPPFALPEPKLRSVGHQLYLPSGRPLRAHYVLTDRFAPVVGETVAVNRTTRMTLYRVHGRVRLDRRAVLPSHSA